MAMCEEGSTQERWHLPVGCVGRGFNTGKMTAIHSALALRRHNSVSFCLSLAPPESPFHCWNPEWIFVSEQDYAWTLYQDTWVSSSLTSHPERIPADFCGQILWGIPFPALLFWAEKASIWLGPLAPHGMPLQLRYISQFSTTTCSCAASLFHFFASPSYHSWCGFSFTVLVLRLLFS